MEILVLGVNHKTAPVALREKLSIPSHKAAELLETLARRNIFRERLLLSTCNRTEIYGVGTNPTEEIEKTKQFLCEYSQLKRDEFENNLYVLKQPDSIQHLFSVASGLDSMVLGETEIIGQVKDAYLAAHKNQQTGKMLNALFQRSFKVAKNIRTHTDIGTGRVSVASVAVELAEKIFESLKNKRVMVIGTGEISTLVAKAMVSRGAAAMIVSSRHFERAQALATELSGEALHFDDYQSRIKDTDVLIAATLAPTALIHKEQVREWMRVRHERPLFLIDIAVPRNIDFETEKLDNVYLYNIDDLKQVAEKNMETRKGELERCSELIRKQTQYFMDWRLKEYGPCTRSQVSA
jgi:glutamyl-tRNA reductase